MSSRNLKWCDFIVINFHSHGNKLNLNTQIERLLINRASSISEYTKSKKKAEADRKDEYAYCASVGIEWFCEKLAVRKYSCDASSHFFLIIDLFYWFLLNVDNFCAKLVMFYCQIQGSVKFNLSKPTGHVMHQQFNIQQLYVLPTLHLCVLYLSENKQRLGPLTA